MSVGYVFGYDDIVANRAYYASLTCVKNYSSVYTIKKPEFIKFFKPKTSSDNWKIMIDLAKQNEKVTNKI